METNTQQRRLVQKLTAWAVGFEERQRFAHLVSRHRFMLAEQEAATDWIYLRAEVLTRQEHPELRGIPREAWRRRHERKLHTWVHELSAQIADQLVDLGHDLAACGRAVESYAAQLGFRRSADLIAALGIDDPVELTAANER